MAVFLLNSRLGLLCATHNTFQHHGPHFFRSYVCFLPSSLTRVLSCALDFSSFLPVSVSGTVCVSLTLDSISRHPDSSYFTSTFSPLPFTAHLNQGFFLPVSQTHCFNRLFQPPAKTRLMRPAFETYSGPGLFHQIPISYGFRPRLRGRLTLGRFPLPRKP